MDSGELINVKDRFEDRFKTKRDMPGIEVPKEEEAPVSGVESVATDHNTLLVLPFRNLPVGEKKSPPPLSLLCEEVRDWSEGDLFKYSFAFMCSTRDPKREEDYFLPLGFVEEDSLVTTVEIIMSVSREMVRYQASPADLRDHVGRYFSELKIVPLWGQPEFYRLLEENKTPRVLEGPNIGGSLKKGETREVIILPEGDLAYGPLSSYIALDK